jgi:hypothetical protein
VPKSVSTFRRRALALGVAALLAMTGLAVGSNMGVMARLTLDTLRRDYWGSIPYRTDILTAQDLCATVGPSATLVSKFDSNAVARTDWACPFGDNFSITPGDGVFIRVDAASELLLLGAHDPGVQVPSGGFAHPLRDYYISLPYHTSASSANDVCGQIPNAALVSRFDTKSGVLEDWTCPFGTNFGLRTGEALRVRVTEPGPGFVPEVF